MRIDENFRFWTFISREGYEKKTDASACLSTKGAKAIGKEKMAFYWKEVTIDEFLKLATTGHAFCNLFNFYYDTEYWFETSKGIKYKTKPLYEKGKNAGHMKLEFKSDRFFHGTQTVFVDIDYTRFASIEDYLNTLTIKPSCVYMSYSDKQEKKGKISRRFRLVYVFDTILDKDTLLRISRSIHESIVNDTGELMEDDCGTRISQYMNGVFGNNECYCSGIIYSASDFQQIMPSYDNVIDDDDTTLEEDDTITFDQNMLRDMDSMSYEKFMHYYSLKYKYVYRTEKADWIDGMYQLTDDNYLQLWWYREKLVDGQRRRRTLFKHACLRRLMYPNIDQNTLLFNLYVDRERFTDNSDYVITLDTLMRRVSKAMSLTMEQLREYCSYELNFWKHNRPKYIIHPNCRSHSCVNTIRKRINYSKIDMVYDTCRSTIENSKELDIPLATLYRYCKDKNIKTVPNKGITKSERLEMNRKTKQEKIEIFKSLYDPTLSLRKNQEIMKKNGLELGHSTIANWQQKYLTCDDEPMDLIEATKMPNYNPIRFNLPKMNFDPFNTKKRFSDPMLNSLTNEQLRSFGLI